MRIQALVSFKDDKYHLDIDGDASFDGDSYEQAVAKAQGVLAHFGKLGEVTTRLKNIDQEPRPSEQIIKELICSGIDVKQQEFFHSIIRPEGELFGLWTFKRAAYEWEVTGPGLPLHYALILYALISEDVKFSEKGENPLHLYKGFSVPKIYATTQRGLLEIGRVLKSCNEDQSYDIIDHEPLL